MQIFMFVSNQVYNYVCQICTTLTDKSYEHFLLHNQTDERDRNNPITLEFSFWDETFDIEAK